jgi:hypothetical protein
MGMQANSYDGFKFTLGGVRGKLIEEILVLLHSIAEEHGHEDIEAWLKSDDFNPDDLVQEYEASYRRTKHKGEYHHQYEWRVDLTSRGEYSNVYCVGVVLVSKKASLSSGKVLRHDFSARKFWGDGKW